MTRDYLRYLAHHPVHGAQHRHASSRVRFVSDTPSHGLDRPPRATSTASGTSIKATLRALVAHPEFAASADAKVRNPIEDFVATVRVLGVKAKKPTQTDDWPFAEAQIWMCQGQYPFHVAAPRRHAADNAAWSSASQVLGSLDLHYSLAGGWVGDKGSVQLPHARVRGCRSQQLRFDSFVDHLSRTLLGRESTPRCSRRRARRPAARPTRRSTRSTRLVQWLMPRLLTAILDTPDHMTR